MLNPLWGTILNFVAGIFGLAETSGITNMLGSSKAGAIAAMVIAFANAGLHGVSSATSGPFVPTQTPPSPPSGGMRTMGIFVLTCLLLWPVGAKAADLKVPSSASTYIDPWGLHFYIGAHVGYGVNIGSDPLLQTRDFGLPSGKAQGFIGGLHAGYGGRAFQNIYLGMESDLDLSGMKNGSGLVIGNTADKVTWLTSTRARAGLIIDKTMLYGTAGWGWGGTEKSFSLISGDAASTSPTQNGFVWGGGVEFALNLNWLARLEYQQYMFGTTSVNGQTASFVGRENVSLIKGGLSYQF